MAAFGNLGKGNQSASLKGRQGRCVTRSCRHRDAARPVRCGSAAGRRSKAALQAPRRLRPTQRRQRGACHDRRSRPDETAPGAVRAGDCVSRGGRAHCTRHRHRRPRDRAPGRFRPPARRDLHDRRGRLHAHHRRAELPQLHDPDAVHADGDGGVGAAVARHPHLRRRMGLVGCAADRRCSGRRGLDVGGALHLPLPEDEAWRCDRAHHSACVLARLPADLRKPDSDPARLRVRSGSQSRSRPTCISSAL